MPKELLYDGTTEVFNIFTPVLNFTSPSLQVFSGYIYLDQMRNGDTVYIRLKINDQIHLYTQYTDRQIMTTVYINPTPLLPGDVLILEAKNISMLSRTLPIGYMLWADVGH